MTDDLSKLYINHSDALYIAHTYPVGDAASYTADSSHSPPWSARRRDRSAEDHAGPVFLAVVLWPMGYWDRSSRRRPCIFGSVCICTWNIESRGESRDGTVEQYRSIDCISLFGQIDIRCGIYQYIQKNMASTTVQRRTGKVCLDKRFWCPTSTETVRAIGGDGYDAG